MSIFLQSLRRIPNWAYLLLFMVVIVNSLFLFFRCKIPAAGYDGEIQTRQVLITKIIPNGPAEKAGIHAGDIIKAIDSVLPTEEYYMVWRQWAGDKATYLIERNNKVFTTTVVYSSDTANILWLLLGIFILTLLLSFVGIFILYKKSDNPAARIFFIYIQLLAISSNAANLFFQHLAPILSNAAFIFSSCISVAALIHFHLLFPRPSLIYTRYRWVPFIFYSIGSLVFIVHSINYILVVYYPTGEHSSNFYLTDRVQVSWMTLAFSIAFGIAVYQFFTIKSTLARNQIRIVIIGSFFGFITPMTFAIFYDFDFIYEVGIRFPFFLTFSQGVGSIIMIFFLLVAIFRYRIWGTEILIRRALLYLTATFVIILTYLLLIFLVDRLTISQTNFTHFIILAVSVIIFLVLRDRIQHLINRLFHRETYDSATVVSDFEAKLAGIYQLDELKQKIVQSLDEIFHFKSFVFNLKKKDLIYEPSVFYGINDRLVRKEYEITPELEEKLQRSKVFSPEELDTKPSLFEITEGELVVPLLSEEKPGGFFLCGPKKSERIYSLQDVLVLSLLARRVIALFHTASLYQKDLDRQLMLERERARISQDMHDDVGASLTRISILSELARNNAENKQWLDQISDTSRGVMEEMSQIIWALNPKNDTLEGLIAYLRRFAFEYLEPTSLKCFFDLPEVIPSIALSVEVRRNIYLSIREALHNVVKHSRATELRISLSLRPSQPHPSWERSFPAHRLIITIKDDGKGFDSGKLEFPGNGLVNMKKRMKDMGGDFLIHSKEGKGTEITLVVPLQITTLW